jgi:Gas vesicle protein.
MKPTKNETHAIVEFLDVLLREGAVIQADVIITVADVPLIGISLRAAIAGMTTMTEYGIFKEWDAAHRTQTRQ